MFWNWSSKHSLEEFLGVPVEAADFAGEGTSSEDLGLRPVSEAWQARSIYAEAFARRNSKYPRLWLRYRASDRVVWSARISDLGLVRKLTVAGQRTPCDLPALKRGLGEPRQALQVGHSLRDHWFERGPLLYVVRAYTSQVDMKEIGGCDDVSVIDTRLAPPGFDDDREDALRNVFLRFPGSHPAFLEALTAALALTGLTEKHGDWAASCGDFELSGDSLEGIESIWVTDKGKHDAAAWAAFVQRVRAAAGTIATVL